MINQDQLLDNPSARVPVCLVLDTSLSMQGDPINELNEGVKMFYNALSEDEIAKYSAEISIVTFGHSAEKVLDFASVTSQSVPFLRASGHTPMGEAVTMALDLLEDRKSEYSKAGVDYYQPWIVLMSDGAPNGDHSVFEEAVSRTCKLVENKKLTIFPIGIGEGVDMEKLQLFSPHRSALKLQGLKFSEFFEWLSKSVSAVSQSIPGDSVDLDTNGLKGWANL